MVATSSPSTARQKRGDLSCKKWDQEGQIVVPRAHSNSFLQPKRSPLSHKHSMWTHRMVLVGDWKLKPHLKLNLSLGPAAVRAPFFAGAGAGARFTGPPSPVGPCMSTPMESVEAMGCDMLLLCHSKRVGWLRGPFVVEAAVCLSVL